MDRELNFILRFRNLGGRALKQAERNFRSFGRAVQGLNLKRISDGFTRLTKTVQNAAKSFEASGRRIREIGTTLSTGLTLPIVAAVAGTTVAFASFETALAGVSKTTNLTGDELEVLGEQFQVLARDLPFSTNELLNVAQSAAQLGVGVENLEEFTTVAAKLGVATDLSAEQAAIALTRLSNASGVPQENFENLGSAVVALGNNFAVFEGELIDIANRIAPAGRAVGLTADQTLALGAAVRSAGIRVEAGGTAISKTLFTIEEAAKTGGPSLTQFARLTGQTADEFAALQARSPVEALLEVARGLNRVQEEGGNVPKLLDDIGLDGIRTSQTLLSLANNSESVARALNLSAEEFERGRALQEEFDRFAGTLAVTFGKLRNRATEVAVEFGEALLPAIRGVAGVLDQAITGARNAVEEFKKLDEGTRTTIVVAGLLVAALGPVLIALGTFVQIVGFAFIGLTKLLGPLKLVLNAFRLLASGPLLAVVAVLTVATAGILALTDQTVTLGRVVTEIGDGVVRVFQTIGKTIAFLISVATTFINNLFSSIRSGFDSLIEFVQAVFAGDFQRALEVALDPGENPFDGIKEQAELFASDIGDLFAPGSAPSADFVNGFKETVATALTEGLGLEAALAKGREFVEALKAGFASGVTGGEGGGGVTESLTGGDAAAGGGEGAEPSLLDRFLGSDFVTGAKDAFAEFADAARETSQLSQDAFANFFDSTNEALLDFVETGEFSFADFGKGVLREFNKILISKITSQLFGLIGGGITGGGSPLFSGITSFFGFNKGGVAGIGGAPGFAPASLFANAQGFQNGGTAGGQDSIPALLTPGEVVLNPQQSRNFRSGRMPGGGGMTVNQTINITTPDPEAFRATQAQLLQELGDGIRRSQERNGA